MNQPKFESSFTGLDLSEFATEKKQSSISASAQLIEVKKQESLRKHNEDQEEALVTAKAAQKAQDQLNRLQQEKEDNEKQRHGKASGFMDALISMHGTDRSGGKREKSRMKTKAQKRTAVSKFKSSASRISKRKGKSKR